ncbi:hypothetical protein NE237_011203 [Protea cynaroides]|uniref:Uncharacterized protein n=1 Tax=Protea cynaroides TaxID=273540 RepID=A0A9Q0GVN8_9MAGN|nr:hypothetical protein NE237_011203 [Protea cynaroides]
MIRALMKFKKGKFLLHFFFFFFFFWSFAFPICSCGKMVHCNYYTTVCFACFYVSFPVTDEWCLHGILNQVLEFVKFNHLHMKAENSRAKTCFTHWFFFQLLIAVNLSVCYVFKNLKNSCLML